MRRYFRERGGVRQVARRATCLVLAAAILAAQSGCTRNFYRKRADQEVDEILTEKDRYPDWHIDQFHVYPDPRARFADATCPDRPPMPPDDPAATDLAPNPQKPGKPGVASVTGYGYLDLLARWDEENRAAAATKREPPEAKEPVQQAQYPERGQAPAQSPERVRTEAYSATLISTEPKPGGPRPYLMTLEQACELAQFNSREYQDAREDLYLTALSVTLERFSFAAQFFAAEEVFRQWTGSQLAGGSAGTSGSVAGAAAATAAATGSASAARTAAESAAAASTARSSASGPTLNSWTANSNFGFAKLFSTGALLLFNFANQTVFNLGPNRFVSSQSQIDLSIVQPFLQGGGKAVTLEPLTQTERNLVYQIRNFARFRKELYVAIAGGGGGAITGANFQPTGVIAQPVFSPQQNLGGSGLTPGIIPGVPATGNPGLRVAPLTAGALDLSVALAAPVSGYLTTLLQSAQMQVDKYNIEKLAGYLDLARALQEGGDISQLQTDQFEQQLLLGRSRLLTDQQNYLLGIDQFKLQLGIPVDVLIELDDTPFRPLNQQIARYEELFRAFKAASDEPLRAGPARNPAEERQRLRRLLTTSDLAKGTGFGSRIESRWASWQKLSEDDLRKRLAAYGEERRRILDKQTELETRGQALGDADKRRLSEVNDDIDLGEFEGILRAYEAQPWKALTDPDLRRRRQQQAYAALANQYVVLLVQARNERIVQIRAQWPELAKVCLDGVDLMKGDLEDAEAVVVRFAEAHRLDLMNVRAQVLDAWRQIAVFANALLAPLNVQYTLNASTPAGVAQPFDFNASRTQQQLILNAELPLVRVRERNNYRAALIGYQRQRRVLQRAEDQVALDVRQELILLRQQLELYRIQTRQIELSYEVAENALDTLQQPPQVGVTGLDTQTRAATLTNQLIQAQTSLYNAQFTMTTIWITYLNDRDQLYRDLELMAFDPRGVWIDNVAECLCPREGESGAGRAAGENKDGTRGQPEALPAPRLLPQTSPAPSPVPR